MSLHHIGFAGWLLASVLIIPPAASGQAPTVDSAGDTLTGIRGSGSASPSDSASVADSASARDTARSALDSLQLGDPGTPVGVDTPQSVPDSIGPSGMKDSTKVAATTPPQPVDSVLKAACGGPDGTLIARDLLVVVFAEESGTRERAAAARSVKGKLIGQAEPGAYYLRVPRGGGEVGLRDAADQLIRLPQVRQVGSRSCPPRSRDTAS